MIYFRPLSCFTLHAFILIFHANVFLKQILTRLPHLTLTGPEITFCISLSDIFIVFSRIRVVEITCCLLLRHYAANIHFF